MSNFNIFGDDRKIPKLTINVKIKVKTRTPEESTTWNTVFGYIMKKPRTKLEFLAVNTLRKLSLNEIKLKDIKHLISETDFNQLNKVEYIFDNVLTCDTKAFILAILKVPTNEVSKLIKTV